MTKLQRSSLLALAAALVAGGCKDIEIKPQDPGQYNRALNRDLGSRAGLERDSGPSLLPENEFATLPETSAPATWTKFKAQRFIQHETALDPSSISVGGDGITRYTLLVRTARGIDNVSYEGIRCSTQEWKMYATGRPDGGWSRTPAPRWQRIEQSGLNAIRYTLWDEYVCDRDGVTPKNGSVVIAKIKKSSDGLLSRRRDGTD